MKSVCYYGGCNEPVGRDGKKRWRALPGLATLRRDGFTSLSVRDKKKPGTLQTIPFALPCPATITSLVRQRQLSARRSRASRIGRLPDCQTDSRIRHRRESADSRRPRQCSSQVEIARHTSRQIHSERR
jgi:hypothetical protein